MTSWRCFACLTSHAGKPDFEHQALPSGLMIRAMKTCVSGMSAEKIEGLTLAFVAATEIARQSVKK